MSDKWKYILMVMGLLTLSAAGVWQNSSVLLPVCAAEIAETSECVTEETGETEYETDIVETETEADTEESEIESETDITETETEGEADVPLQIRLAADGDLPGQPDIYRGHVMLSYAIEGEAYSGEEVVWKICCYRAGTVERLEFTGNAEELAKCEDEWGIEIKKSPEEVDSRLVFSMEGRYSVQVLIADQKVNPVESEICHFTIDRTEPDVRIREFSKAAGGYGIYGRRESPVVMVEVADVSGVSEITYAVKDTSGYERTGELMKEDRKRASAKWQGSIEPDLSEFADGRIEVRVSASDYAGNRSDPVILFLYTDTRDRK